MGTTLVTVTFISALLGNKSNNDKTKNTETAELREHYDFDYSAAKPNRFATRLAQEPLIVVIDPDLAAIFPTSEAVNEALRVLATAAQKLPHTTPKRPRKPRKTTAVPGE